MTPDEITKQDLKNLVEKLRFKQLEEEKKILIAQSRSDAFGQARVYAEQSLDDFVKQMTERPNA